MEVETNKTFQEMRVAINKCEGKHLQQVSYSTYHQALTQVCFGCNKVRTELPKELISDK